MRADPVVVLAAGVVTPLGADVESFWSGLVTGAEGISAIERFPVAGLRVQRGGEIKKLSLPRRGLDRRGRASALLVAVATDLVAHASPWCAPERLAVVTGTALGAVDDLERTLGDARRAPRGLYDQPAHDLARWLGATGPVVTVSTACAAGATALGVGGTLLHDDAADLVVAGGYDPLCPFVMRGFDTLRSLSRERVRPFDRRRSGLLLGEGAALVLLARERDVRHRPRLGRLLGQRTISDASHLTAPDPDGRGLERAIRTAMADADVTAADIDFVSAHGTGTPLNDRVEAAVLGRVLGSRAVDVPVNSIKGALGHTMGAAATLEAIMCLLATRHGTVPHTVGLEELDPACALDCVRGEPRALSPRVSLSTSLGFGGSNAALVLEGAPC